MVGTFIVSPQDYAGASLSAIQSRGDPGGSRTRYLHIDSVACNPMHFKVVVDRTRFELVFPECNTGVFPIGPAAHVEKVGFEPTVYKL